MKETTTNVSSSSGHRSGDSSSAGRSSIDRNFINRVLFYLLGLIVLAVGITLNTKTELGVSPIISVSYCVSTILNANFGNMTFLLYTLFVVVEIVIHICQKRFGTIPKDCLQIALSLVFTRFMNLFSAMIPDFTEDLGGTVFETIPMRVLFLLVAIILTGIGAALSLNARLVPNPGDGIVQAIADVTGWTTGFTKNCVDITCVCSTCIASFLMIGHIVGIGLGTILAMIGTGRVIAVFNHLTMQKIKQLSGLAGGISGAYAEAEAEGYTEEVSEEIAVESEEAEEISNDINNEIKNHKH